MSLNSSPCTSSDCPSPVANNALAAGENTMLTQLSLMAAHFKQIHNQQHHSYFNESGSQTNGFYDNSSSSPQEDLIDDDDQENELFDSNIVDSTTSTTLPLFTTNIIPTTTNISNWMYQVADVYSSNAPFAELRKLQYSIFGWMYALAVGHFFEDLCLNRKPTDV
uniref:Uncharacterized protein n=1 Tax=Ditylenchus dipsaci TaxID=166011 RepID=A0A915EJ69_9BILA